jgi:hypothetical protein
MPLLFRDRVAPLAAAISRSDVADLWTQLRLENPVFAATTVKTLLLQRSLDETEVKRLRFHEDSPV